MSQRKTIIDALVAQLITATGAPVYKTRRDPIPEDKLPAIVIEPDREPNTQETLGRVDVMLTVAISVLFTGAATDSANDTLIGQVQQLIETGLSLGAPQSGIEADANYDIEFTDESIDLGRAIFRTQMRYVRNTGAV